MNKKFTFLFGLLIGVTLTLILWEYGFNLLAKHFQEAIAFYVIVTVLLVSFLVLVYFRIDRALNENFSSGKKQTEQAPGEEEKEPARNIAQMIQSKSWDLLEGELHKSKAELQKVFARWTLTNWIFRTVQILILGFVGIFGAILVINQNTLIEGQNALIKKQAFQDSLQTDLLVLQDTLLMAQNLLFGEQNKKVGEQIDLLEGQNVLFGSQNQLFKDQNKKVDDQIVLLDKQNILFENQNTNVAEQTRLFQRQNGMIDTQNIRLTIQNNLLEADRRSSLVFLMSNVLDKVDTEIQQQRDTIAVITDSTTYSLSKPLIGRITALSKGFKPYRTLEGDTLSGKLLSPERGQLFIALMESDLDSLTQNRIVSEGDFSYADIGKLDLRGAKFRRAKLRGANLIEVDLYEADLYGADLYGADLIDANLTDANLRFADLNRADLHKANLNRADLLDADLIDADLIDVDLTYAVLLFADLTYADLTYADLRGADLRFADLIGADLREADLDYSRSDSLFVQLLRTDRLYNCKNLDPEIEAQLKDKETGKPCLFLEYGCLEEENTGSEYLLKSDSTSRKLPVNKIESAETIKK